MRNICFKSAVIIRSPTGRQMTCLLVFYLSPQRSGFILGLICVGSVLDKMAVRLVLSILFFLVNSTVPVLHSHVSFIYQWQYVIVTVDGIWHSEDRTSLCILIIKPTRCTIFSNLFLEYMFRTVSLSIIRSLTLYTQQLVYVVQVMLIAC
jgi:hypothetical protein